MRQPWNPGLPIAEDCPTSDPSSDTCAHLALSSGLVVVLCSHTTPKLVSLSAATNIAYYVYQRRQTSDPSKQRTRKVAFAAGMDGMRLRASLIPNGRRRPASANAPALKAWNSKRPSQKVQ